MDSPSQYLWLVHLQGQTSLRLPLSADSFITHTAGWISVLAIRAGNWQLSLILTSSAHVTAHRTFDKESGQRARKVNAPASLI